MCLKLKQALTLAASKEKGKGIPMRKAGTHGYRPRVSHLSIEDRRRKLQEIKARSACKKCGKKGHWAGDRECTAPTGTHQKSKGDRKRVRHLAVVESGLHDAACQTECGPSSSSNLGASPTPHFNAPAFSLPDAASRNHAAYMGVLDHLSGGAQDKHDDIPDFPTELEVMSDPDVNMPDEPPDGHFTFGQHKDMTYGEVLWANPGYAVWALDDEGSTAAALKEFFVWVNRHYVLSHNGDLQRRYRSLNSTDAKDLSMLKQRAKGTTKPRTRQSKLAFLKPNPQGPCDPSCPPEALTRSGSTVKFIQTTCLKCGHKTRMPPKATEDPATSRHKRADHRGSTKKVHKTFCLDCCTHLDEIPQSKHKETAELVEAVKKSAWSVQNLAKSSGNDSEASCYRNFKVCCSDEPRSGRCRFCEQHSTDPHAGRLHRLRRRAGRP